jgi:hypothetical protein
VSGPLLDAFADAWRSLQNTVQRLEAASDEQREAARGELVAAVDEALSTRRRAREALAAQHGGDWKGDQILFVREVAVGALSRELDGFTEWWPSDGGGLLAGEILERVRPLLVEPGNPEAHQP